MCRAANQSGTDAPIQSVAASTQLAPEWIIDAVGPHAPSIVVHRHEVETRARFEIQGPVVLGNAGQHVPAGQLPGRGDHAVLDPEHAVAFELQRDVEARVLLVDVGMQPRAAEAQLRLVEHQVLHGGRGLDQLPAGPEVVELGVRQRHHGAGERADLRVRLRRQGAEREPELRIQLVVTGFASGETLPAPPRPAHEHGHRPLAEQPHAGVHEVEVVRSQLPNALGGRLLEEERQLRRPCAWTEEHAEVLRGLRPRPHAQPQHVHLGKGRQILTEAQQHVAARDHGDGGGRRVREHAFVLGQLEIKQRLVETLAPGPAEDGHRHQQLPGCGIRGQAPTLTAAVDDQLAVRAEPVRERTGPGSCSCHASASR